MLCVIFINRYYSEKVFFLKSQVIFFYKTRKILRRKSLVMGTSNLLFSIIIGFM